jgi:hypothetical protein
MKRRVITAWVLWLGLSLSAAYSGEAAEEAAIAAAQSWLGEIDSGNYGRSWKEASSFFQGAVPEKGWMDALTGARKPLGKLISRKLANAQSATSLPGAPDGRYLIMQFDTSFENKRSAIELVTFTQEKDGHWRAAGYYIR